MAVIPLGAIWTQEHIALAIKKIGLQPIVEVPVKDLSKPSASVQCESYADIRRLSTGKVTEL